MKRPIVILGAASNIGIRPYDNGVLRQLDRTPSVLRDLGLSEKLGAKDRGDIKPPAYRDFVRPPGRARNESEVADYSIDLGKHVAAAGKTGDFVLLLGGECSIVLAGLLGARQAAGGPVGLAYVDGHADFATPEESITGSVASMCLALAVGRGDPPLARLNATGPLVQDRHVALLGRRDHAEPWYGHTALAASRIQDLPAAELQKLGFAEAGRRTVNQLTAPGIQGFWIHVDADVLDAEVMSAVDSPQAGGPDIQQLVTLLAPLVQHPRAIGLELTIYDPGLDSDRICARRLVELLVKLFAE